MECGDEPTPAWMCELRIWGGFGAALPGYQHVRGLEPDFMLPSVVVGRATTWCRALIASSVFRQNLYT